MPNIHPIAKVQRLFTDLENALDDLTVLDDTTPQQEMFVVQMLKKVQELSQELDYEVAEKEDYDSYMANKAGDVDDISY